MIDIDNLKKWKETYEKKKDIYDKIVGAVSLSKIGEGERYTYWRDHVGLSNTEDIGTKYLEADLVFLNNINKCVLLIEETLDPSNKEEQLIGYLFSDTRIFKSIMGTESKITVEIMTVSPTEKIKEGQDMYNLLKGEEKVKKAFSKRGFTFWNYPPNWGKIVKTCGHHICDHIKELNISELKVRDINMGYVYKTDPPLALLRHLILILMEELGENKIRVTGQKLQKIFGIFGIDNISKLKETLKLGEIFGLFENVDIDALYGELKYHKKHHSSVKVLSDFLNDPIKFAEEKNARELKSEQKKLSDFNKKL